MKEEVILVDTNDVPLGTMPKMEAHEKAILHRAFSVFILNKEGQLMLQQRALSKYHSPGLWTNTCCSHQRLGETNIEAGTRRLQEEMGFKTPLKELFSFVYKATFDNGLTEHEFDHVILGYYDSEPIINHEEVTNWKWMNLEEIIKEIKTTPDNYTAWFKIIFDRFYNHIKA
ncbi:isopentenyl-diphosphate Delta-isomerase [Flavobacteriaceae bacterium]|jgi:isopentenyl-diphosphate delta-isomerase|nr:isopentenyl-diphosphate Delta-isomerase [Flavobacteriaceae bacterium]|tara:strand:- start:413 stop:928 length:516 start_codon:yes stop_codon:yes gene_type:complete